MFKYNKYLRNIVNTIFLIVVVAIFLVTSLFDNNIAGNVYKNEVSYANGGYYIFAFLITLAILIIGKKVAIKEKYIIIYAVIIGGITLLIQTIVTFWSPIICNNSDFGNICSVAIKIANGGTFEGEAYFARCCNQVNLTIILSWLYKIVKSWRAIIWISALLTNVSVIMMMFLLYKLTKNIVVSVAMCITGEFLIALSWRAFMPYTDAWAMIFVMAATLIYFSNIRSKYKYPLVLILGLIGTWIKILAVIILIACVIYSIITTENKNIKENIFTKKTVYYCAITICIVTIYVCGSMALNNIYKFKKDESTLSWKYYLMLGQNNDNMGQVDSKEFTDTWTSINNKDITIDEKMELCKKQAIEWIKNRGVAGNIIYYLKVLDVCFDDGRFNVVHPFEYNSVKHNIVYDFYCKDGKYYKLLSNVYQIVWDYVLINFTLGFVILYISKNTKKCLLFFELTILGVICYLIIFEDRAKYLFMFLPLMITCSGIVLNDIQELYNNIRKQLKNKNIKIKNIIDEN